MQILSSIHRMSAEFRVVQGFGPWSVVEKCRKKNEGFWDISFEGHCYRTELSISGNLSGFHFVILICQCWNLMKNLKIRKTNRTFGVIGRTHLEFSAFFQGSPGFNRRCKACYVTPVVSTSPPGGNQVDGSPPAGSSYRPWACWVAVRLGTIWLVETACLLESNSLIGSGHVEWQSGWELYDS